MRKETKGRHEERHEGKILFRTPNASTLLHRVGGSSGVGTTLQRWRSHKVLLSIEEKRRAEIPKHKLVASLRNTCLERVSSRSLFTIMLREKHMLCLSVTNA